MPSEKILSQKQAEVADLVKKMQAAQSGVVVNYSGITVEQDTKLRAALRKAGVEYSVKKNSLIGRACDELGFEDMKSALNGMSAIATSETDPVAPAKILKEYADKIPTFEIKTGFLEGKVVDTATLIELAEIPSKEVMVGKILGSIQSSLYALAFGLQAIVDKKSAEENA